MATDTIEDISGADVFDIRDVIERFEELETERENACIGDTDREDDYYLEQWDKTEDGEEYAKFKSLLDDVRGYGGDHQWRGDWYPVSFIRDSYFVDAMKELVQDIIGDLPRDIPTYLEIDWEKTADNLRADYSSVEFDGNTYWYR